MSSPPTFFSFLVFLALLVPVSQARGQVSVDVPAPAASSRPAGKVLAPRFLRGRTYRFVTTSAIRMQVPGRGNREVLVEQQARLDATERPQGKPGAQLRAMTEKLSVVIRSGTKSVSYDSLKPKDRESTLGKHFQSAVNRWVVVQLDPKMRIVDSEEGGQAGAATPLPGMPQFGPDELKQLIAAIPQGFAPDPVSVGDEWVLKGEKEVQQAGKLNFDITYRYLGPFDYEGHPTANIEFSGTMSGGAGTADFEGTTVVGRLVFDPAAKMVRYSEQTVSMTLNLPVPGRPGETIPVPMDQRVTSRLLHIVPSKAR